MVSEDSSTKSGIRLSTSIDLMTFIAAIGLGYLEAGIRGAVAGAVGAGIASLLSWLGFLPIVGQVLYILLWDKVSSWIHGLVKISYALVIPYYMGLISSIILSVIVIIVIVGVLLS